MKDLAASVEKHYSEWTGFEAIIENLKRKGIDLARVRAQDLYPYDQSHAGGIEATAMLAPSVEVLLRLRDKYGKSVEWLLSGES